jgi:hypothetical protein
MNHVICPNEKCRSTVYIGSELWDQMTQPGSLAVIGCPYCSWRIPGAHLQNIKHRLNHGWWSIGNAGHVILHNDAGDAYPEKVVPDDPSTILGPLPFLMVRANRVGPNNELPPAEWVHIPVGQYGDCRDEVLGGVAYKAWYKKRMPLVKHGEKIQLELSQDEIDAIVYAAKKMYGDEAYACVSEMVMYDGYGQFVHRGNIDPLALGAFNGVTIDVA